MFDKQNLKKKIFFLNLKFKKNMYNILFKIVNVIFVYML